MRKQSKVHAITTQMVLVQLKISAQSTLTAQSPTRAHDVGCPAESLDVPADGFHFRYLAVLDLRDAAFETPTTAAT